MNMGLARRSCLLTHPLTIFAPLKPKFIESS